MVRLNSVKGRFRYAFSIYLDRDLTCIDRSEGETAHTVNETFSGVGRRCSTAYNCRRRLLLHVTNLVDLQGALPPFN